MSETGDNRIDEVKTWYDQSFSQLGPAAQRKYPNEEFIRFLGRNFFGLPLKERSAYRFLDVGFGSCANAWVVAHEGFSVTGIDVSDHAVAIGREIMQQRGLKADLVQGSMDRMPFEDASFEVVYDIFSSNCLTIEAFCTYLGEVRRVLSKGGLFFLYTPSTESDAFRDHAPAKLLDGRTLNGVYRETSPFSGNHYPFRFTEKDELRETCSTLGLRCDYLETVTRTYRNMAEVFQFLVGEFRGT